jgi:hypothetical protein
MNYDLHKNANGLDVDLCDIDGIENELLAVFEQCREGRCNCPTREYSKLDSIEIEKGDDRIHLRLNAKQGMQFEASQIERCILSNERRIMRNKA